MYTINHYAKQKPIVVQEHTRSERPVRAYTKGHSWHMRLRVWIWSWLRLPVVYTLCALIFVSSMTAAFFAGELYDSQYHPQTIALVTVAHAEAITNPIEDQIQRIGFAETRLNQFCNEDVAAHYPKVCTKAQYGSVLMTTNTNGSIDIGKYAINNRVWEAKAVQLGYNIYTEQGNHDMAVWIATNAGVKQWNASASRWK